MVNYSLLHLHSCLCLMTAVFCVLFGLCTRFRKICQPLCRHLDCLHKDSGTCGTVCVNFAQKQIKIFCVRVQQLQELPVITTLTTVLYCPHQLILMAQIQLGAKRGRPGMLDSRQGVDAEPPLQHQRIVITVKMLHRPPRLVLLAGVQSEAKERRLPTKPAEQ